MRLTRGWRDAFPGDIFREHGIPPVTDPLDRLRTALAGRYTLGPELGAGGMATVRLADDLKHHRQVAVKVLRPELGAMLGADRFLHEIRVTAKLQHSHILPLFDSGAEGGLLWYAMPRVDGESLRDRIAREGALPIETALTIAVQVASALDYAHRHGVIHRDIKPGNILLAEDQALVADFGIALGLEGAAPDRMTLTGLSLGTPQYMSPEQAQGSPDVDARSDVYALGCVLFEMVTGRAPYTGSTPQSVIAQLLTGPPPPVSSLRGDCPEALDGIVARALEQDPARRYQTAGEFGAALRALLGASTAMPSAAAARRTRRRTRTAVAVAVVALSAWLALRPRPPAIPEVGRTERVTFDPGVELDPAIAPDGRMMAYAGGSVGRTRIYVRQLAGGSPVALSEGLGGVHRSPRWTPDGAHIVFLASGDGRPAVYSIPALGGPVRRLVELPPDSEMLGYGLSPDGSTVAYTVSDSVIQLQPVDGGPARAIATERGPHTYNWSPDGAYLAFTSGNPTFVLGTAALGNVAPSEIRVIPTTGGASVSITSHTSLNVSPVWAPDGRGLFFVSNRGGARDVWFQPLTSDRAPRGDPVRLTTGLQAHTIDVSADGTRMLYSALRMQANLWRVAIPPPGQVATPENATRLTSGSQAIEGVGLSPDGAWLAFDSDLAGNQQIYRMPAAGGTPQRLTNHPADDFLPAWSPDGQRIAFYSFRTGNRDIFVMDADGGALEQVTSNPTHERVPDWSPDGRSLVFYSDQTGRAELFVITRTEDDRGWQPPRRLTFHEGANPRWSPDGREIAYRRGFSIEVIPAEGGEPRVVVAPGDRSREPAPHWVEWAPDGRTLYYKTLDPDGRSTIFAVPARGGTPRPVLMFPDPAQQSPRTEFATDGRVLYFTLGTHEADIWTLELRRR